MCGPPGGRSVRLQCNILKLVPPGMKGGGIPRRAPLPRGALAVAFVPLAPHCRRRGGRAGRLRGTRCVPRRGAWAKSPVMGCQGGSQGPAGVIGGSVRSPLHLSPGADAWDCGYWSSERWGAVNLISPSFSGYPWPAAEQAGATGAGGLRVRGLAPAFAEVVGAVGSLFVESAPLLCLPGRR